MIKGQAKNVVRVTGGTLLRISRKLKDSEEVTAKSSSNRRSGINQSGGKK